MVGALLLAVTVAEAPCAGVDAAPDATQSPLCRLSEQPADPQNPQLADLTSIFSRPEFKQARERNTGALQVWLNRLKAWLMEIFGSSAAATFSDVTRLLVLFGGALVAVMVGLRFFRRGARTLTVHTDAGQTQSLNLDDPAVHLERARALLSAQPREATREGLLALLSTLERHRLARPDRVKTNRELVAELPSKAAASGIVDAVTSSLTWYDRAYYSLEPIEMAQAQQFIESVSALTRRIGSSAS